MEFARGSECGMCLKEDYTTKHIPLIHQWQELDTHSLENQHCYPTMSVMLSQNVNRLYQRSELAVQIIRELG